MKKRANLHTRHDGLQLSDAEASALDWFKEKPRTP